MEAVKVTVTVEDAGGVIWTETVDLPLDEVFLPGMATPGMLPVAEALLKAAKGQ